MKICVNLWEPSNQCDGTGGGTRRESLSPDGCAPCVCDLHTVEMWLVPCTEVPSRLFSAALSPHGSLYVILRRLADLTAVEEGLGAVAVGEIYGVCGSEVDSLSRDVRGDGELLTLHGTLAANADLERAETVEFHGVRFLQLVGHDLDEFGEHRLHVGFLHRTVLLDDVSDVVGRHVAYGDSLGIPLAVCGVLASVCVRTLHLLQFVKYWHNVLF